MSIYKFSILYRINRNKIKSLYINKYHLNNELDNLIYIFFFFIECLRTFCDFFLKV